MPRKLLSEAVFNHDIVVKIPGHGELRAILMTSQQNLALKYDAVHEHFWIYFPATQTLETTTDAHIRN